MTIYANLLGKWTKLDENYCINGNPNFEDFIVNDYLYNDGIPPLQYIQIITPDNNKHYVHFSQVQVIDEN